MCERYSVSNTVGAALASSTLQSAGIITSSNKSDVIDRNKVFRARKLLRLQSKSHVLEKVTSFYFDGRKDLTLTNNYVNGVYVKRKKMEEHISMISEPGNK